MRKIILASASPQRKNILKLINFDFEIEKSNFDEKKIKIDHQKPKEYCSYIAQQKSKNIAENYPESIVLGSDTIVYHDNKILGKPNSKEEAVSYLKKLSGKEHYVYTALSLKINAIGLEENIIEKTIVSFNNLSKDDINYYVTNYNPFNKAGGYGIQDWGSTFVKKINGCYYNVVGFPLSKFYILFNQIKNK
jgi:septum formation protein